MIIIQEISRKFILKKHKAVDELLIYFKRIITINTIENAVKGPQWKSRGSIAFPKSLSFKPEGQLGASIITSEKKKRNSIAKKFSAKKKKKNSEPKSLTWKSVSRDQAKRWSESVKWLEQQKKKD